LPRRLVEPLRQQMKVVKQWHQRDLSRGFGRVWLPPALRRKYARTRERGQTAASHPRRFIREGSEARGGANGVDQAHYAARISSFVRDEVA
jgi:hypothetical protein